MTETRTSSAPDARGEDAPGRGFDWLRPLRATGDILRQSAVEWWRDESFQLAAALAFYTVFSLAPLVVIAMAIVGAVFGEEMATRKLVGEVESLVGSAGGDAVRLVLHNAQTSPQGPIATVVGIVTVVVGSTAVFAQLQTALNRIWNVEASPQRGMLLGILRSRLLGFGLAIGGGFVLVVALIASAVLSATQETLTAWMPDFPWLWRALELGVSFLLVAGMFMAVYKILPDVELEWRDVAVGAFVSSLLFSIGKLAIGFYLGRMSIGDVYGAAGSFAVLLVWVYYTALVSFFGAEFTQVYARCYGSRIRPSDHAVVRAR